MEIFFGNNLKLLRERKKRSQALLAEFIGIKRSILNNYENRVSMPSVENLLLISEYFNINMNTLLRVNFARLKESELRELETGMDMYIKGSKLRVLATTVNADNEDNLEMVSAKTKAGYIAGYADSEFISSLPRGHFPMLQKGRKYRAFQIEGDSMPPVRDKSWIVCTYIDDWNDIRNGESYVIVTKEGLVFKRVYNHIQPFQKLQLVSLNPEYSPYDIQIENVVEVWRFVLELRDRVADN